MSYTPTPEEARAIAEMIRIHGLPSMLNASKLADRLDPPRVTADQAREAVGRLRQWRDAAPRDAAVALLNLFIDQHDDEAKP